MPSSLSHAMVAVAAASAIAPRHLIRPFIVAGAVTAVVPDLDAIGRPFGFGDIAMLGGHRGLTHSLTFAALVGALAALAVTSSERWGGARVRFGVYMCCATAAHGALDAVTSIGALTSPVQFFYPFSSRGFVSPWQPIHGPFSELFLCLLPLLLVTYVICRVRRVPRPRKTVERPVELGRL